MQIEYLIYLLTNINNLMPFRSIFGSSIAIETNSTRKKKLSNIQ